MSAHPKSFIEQARAAFPASHRDLGEEAGRLLAPHVDAGSLCGPSIPVMVQGGEVSIPSRVYLCARWTADSTPPEAASAQCLCTRSTNGYLRQAALRCIAPLNQPWSIPFVALLAGDYVIEIVEDVAAALPSLDRDCYIDFTRRNRSLMQTLRSRAASYWDLHHRGRYPDLARHPGLAFLRELERWAA